MVTFRKSYDKLIKAYLEDKIIPTESCNCFVGNLLNNTRKWRFARKDNFCGTINIFYNEPSAKEGLLEIEKEGEGFYNLKDVSILEDVFMNTWCENRKTYDKVDENALYLAFEAALLKLKQLHESKGEIVEDYAFEKRELQLN